MPVYATIYETTNLSGERSSNHYELDDADESIPKKPEVNGNAAGLKSSEIYQDMDSSKARVQGMDNLGYIDGCNENPYHHSLEETLNENIYDRVTEEPHDHVYHVLEKPN